MSTYFTAKMHIQVSSGRVDFHGLFLESWVLIPPLEFWQPRNARNCNYRSCIGYWKYDWSWENAKHYINNKTWKNPKTTPKEMKSRIPNFNRKKLCFHVNVIVKQLPKSIWAKNHECITKWLKGCFKYIKLSWIFVLEPTEI